jgi:hypothetical protein
MRLLVDDRQKRSRIGRIPMTMVCAGMLMLNACGMQRSTVGASEPHGIISVTGSVVTDGIHPVILNRLDGRYMSLGSSRIPPDASLVIVDRGYQFTEPNSFWVAPGVHELVLTAVFRRGNEIKLPPQNPRRGDMLGKLTLEVEQGKRYYIGARIVGSRYDQWTPVVYRVESIGRAGDSSQSE